MQTLKDLANLDMLNEFIKQRLKMIEILDPENPNDAATIQDMSYEIVCAEQEKRDYDALVRRSQFRLIIGGKQ